MAELNFPNIAGNFQSGYAFGTKMRDDRQAQQDNAALRGLAPQILAGDPNAYSQAAAIDPQAAGQFQQAGNSQLRKLKGYVDFVENARASGNIQAVNAALREGNSLITSITGKPGPTEWTDDMEPGWQQLKARVAMADFGVSPGGRVQSRFTNDQGEVIALMADGTMVRTGERAAPNIKILEQEGQVPTGYVTSGGRAGAAVPLGGGQAVPQGQPTPGTRQYGGGQMSIRNEETGQPINPADLPPEEQAALFRTIATGETVNLPPAGGGMAQGGPVRTPTAAERAYATEEATQQVRTAYLPQQEAIETQAAVDRAREEARVKREADLASAAQKKYVDATTTLGLLDEAEALIGKSTGSLVGSARDAVAGAFGTSTQGAQAIAQLQPIAASLTLAVPRMEGPQSDADRLLYQKAAGDFANPNVPTETRMAALVQMRRLAQKYVSPAGSAPSGNGGMTRIQSAADYNAIPSGSLYIAPDGSQRRKR